MKAERPDNNALLFEFLLELVLGQYNSVPPELHVSESGDKGFSRVQDLLLLLSEELRTLLLHKGLVHPRKRIEIIQYGILLLDENFVVRGLGSSTASFFGRSEVSMYRSDFSSYMVPSSQKDFFTAVTALQQGTVSQPQFLRLTFHAVDQTLHSADCCLDLLLYGKGTFIVSLFSLKPVVSKNINPIQSQKQSFEAIQQVYDYIESHEAGALPSAQEFARRYGTNEYDLKKEFKKHFGTSIYQHYTHIRLNRAHDLMYNTTMALSEIAAKSGFEDYSSFAKAYVKRYGISPAKARELR